MNKARHDPQLKAQLDALEGNPVLLLTDYSEDVAFWKAFSIHSEPIVAGATAQDAAHAQGRIDCMLKNLGMIPGEDEAEPCALLLGVRIHPHRTTEPQQLGT